VEILVDILLLQTVSIAIASAGVFAAAVYYIFQIRHQTRMRQTDLVMKLYSEFRSLEFQKMWQEVMKREAKDHNVYSHEYGTAEFLSVGIFFEGIGILLKRKLVDIELVDDMFTSPIKLTWEKVKDITLEARKVRNQPEIFEWFEYLYTEMKKRDQKLQQRGVKSG
jgi:hypothetical protein